MYKTVEVNTEVNWFSSFNKEVTQMKEHLSIRGQALSKDMPLLARTHFDIVKDLYDPKNNPDGYINMCTAETHLVNDEAIALLSKTQSRLQLKAAHIQNAGHSAWRSRRCIFDSCSLLFKL